MRRRCAAMARVSILTEQPGYCEARRHLSPAGTGRDIILSRRILTALIRAATGAAQFKCTLFWCLPVPDIAWHYDCSGQLQTGRRAVTRR